MIAMTLDDVVGLLRSADSRPPAEDEAIAAMLATSKEKAVADNDEAVAKQIWCLEQSLKSHRQYAESFRLLKAARYYDAWCELERLELTLKFLRPHFQDRFAEFRLDFIDRHCRRWQELFPYKIFMSPEIIEHEKVCSICRAPISIRNPCGHRVGEIYGGEMCCRIVTKPEFIGTAFVKSPIQKYSVPFLVDPKTGQSSDHYNYKLVEYPIRRLASAFHEWEFAWTHRRHPHSRFTSFGRNDKCPCESGKKYKRCCLPEVGVLRPHIDFTFHVPPSPELLGVEYSEP